MSRAVRPRVLVVYFPFNGKGRVGATNSPAKQTSRRGDILVGTGKAELEVLFARRHMNKDVVYPSVHQRGPNAGLREFYL